jgi:hypothetical protein
VPRSRSPEAVRNPQAMRSPPAADPREREQRLLEQIGELRNDGGCGGVADLPSLEGPNCRTAFPQARPRVRSRDIEQAHARACREAHGNRNKQILRLESDWHGKC